MKYYLPCGVALCFALLSISAARAQTNLYVGSNTPANTLDLTSGTNDYEYTYIGFTSDASNNVLGVANAGTLLTNSASLYVGYGGSGNNFIITDGGTVASATGDIGFDAVASNNSVLVTGTNSLWTNSGNFDTASFLTVGVSGSGNSLVISNGGTVVSGSGYIGFSATSSNNNVLVTGAGSLWTNSNDVVVGEEGGGNSLVISNGGTVRNLGNIGYRASSSNNSVLLTGTNSVIITTEEVHVGYLGSGNSLVISNGGTLRLDDEAFTIGDDAGSYDNSVLVTGAGSFLDIRESDLLLSDDGINSTLTVADGGSVFTDGDLRIANGSGSSGTLNIGRFGTNDTGGTIVADSISFRRGTGVVNFNQSDAVTISFPITQPLGGQGTINQLGSGTTTLSGIDEEDSTFTGATTVAAGKLIVDGSIAGSTVTVNSGGTLAGSGTVGGIVLNLGSTLSPGNSPGTLNVAGNAVWNPGANYNWQLYDTTLGAGTGWDLVNAAGTLDLTALTVGSEFKINLWSLSAIAPDSSGNALNFDPNQNYTWTILSAAGGITGFTGSSQFDINVGAFNGTAGFANGLDGGSFSVAQNGNDLNLVFTAAGGAPIPEPGTWAAAALLVGGAAFLRWRKRKQVV